MPTLRHSDHTHSHRYALPVLALLLLLPLAAPATAAPHASIIVDANSAQVLHSQNADAYRYPASLTKIMTLYVLFDALKTRRVDMSTRFVVSANAAAQAPSKLGLKPGSTIMVVDAIRALVTKSANDVAVVVAENLGGTEENFAKTMTATARRIGMSKTTFRNASGLPDDEQVTTASDMVTMARRLMNDFPQYYHFFGTTYFSYNGKRYRNHNKLLFNYEGTDGIKTGYTRASGFNLVASVRRNNKHLIGVVMGGKTGAQRDAQMRKLFDKAMPKAVAFVRPVPMPDRNPIAQDRKDPPPAAVASAGTPAAILASAVPSMPEPAPREVEEGDASANDFHIQVGAYLSQADASRRLREVQQKGATVLEGRQPLTLTFAGKTKQLYRARFAGFTEDDARAACRSLKGLDITCIVRPAE